MLPRILSLFQFFSFQIFESLVLHSSLEILIVLLHIFCPLYRCKFYILNSFGIVDRLLKLLGIRKISEIHANGIKESHNARE